MTARSLADHRDAVAAALRPSLVLDVLLADAVGATLAEDLVAPSDLPPTPVAERDGYAVVAADTATASADAPVSLAVSHDVSFDVRAPRRHVRGAAARVPSGAAVPTGADAVVALSDTDMGVAKVGIARPVQRGEGVREAGFDARGGTVLVAAGTRLGPRQVAAAAALGRARVRVRPVPRVVVLAVGDELIEPGTSRPGGGVAEATTHMIAALVQEAGAKPYRVGAVPDDALQLRGAIEDQLVRADMVITTGGLSDGPQDTVADVLARMGRFTAVDLQLRPGRRHGLGVIDAGDREVPVVALPGSPAAAAMGFEAYVRRAVRVLCGHPNVERAPFAARARRRWIAAPGVVTGMPVVVERDADGMLSVTPLGAENLSLADLARADAVVWSGPDAHVFDVGDTVSCTVWGG
ncbi:gephyrin-like molybdotransferase Glp [Demequina sp. NBRC 110053]|uniref:molybdopterin molybdotransferase MoeA n=1 Tax=Demequina sp. NBRC 110053 TaxID=1570342 RepID=UPI0009FFB2F5|nr:gephyrin-like molybdotransferase Glp [Demequina sp. NBRC 110053]